MANDSKVSPETKLSDAGHWSPVVLEFEYLYQTCSPCCEPLCCCPCCWWRLLCPPSGIPCYVCQSQKAKSDAILKHCMEHTKRQGLMGKGKPVVAYYFEHTPRGLKAVEIFRNVQAAETYYTKFMAQKMLLFEGIQLAFRQKDIYKKMYANPEEVKTGPQLVKYNHPKLDPSATSGMEFEAWGVEGAPPTPTVADLLKKWKIHYGWVDEPSMCEGETADGEAPKQDSMVE